MGFGDRFKDLTQQAREKVAENREKIQEAVDAASVVANEKTSGKYANRITKVNAKTGSALDKFTAKAGDSDDPSPAAAPPSTPQSGPPQFADEMPPSRPPASGEPPKFDDEL